MVDTITVRNISDHLVLVGDNYLFPNQSRDVPVYQYEVAAARHPGALSPAGQPGESDSPQAAVVIEETEGEDEGVALVTTIDMPEDAALLTVDYELPDLDGMTKAGLVELAKRWDIAPGKKTKAELVAEIQAAVDEMAGAIEAADEEE